jgi:hypothetical protein
MAQRSLVILKRLKALFRIIILLFNDAQEEAVRAGTRGRKIVNTWRDI